MAYLQLPCQNADVQLMPAAIRIISFLSNFSVDVLQKCVSSDSRNVEYSKACIFFTIMPVLPKLNPSTYI